MRTILRYIFFTSGFVFAIHAQTATAAFEVTSVKPVADDAPRGITGVVPKGGIAGGGTIRYPAVTLRALIVAAYDVNDFQVIGPGWLDQSRFEVIAKAPVGSSDDQLAGMLRDLLSHRFHLQLHSEKRPGMVYTLTVERGGIKFPRSVGGDQSIEANSKAVIFRNITLDALADQLSRRFGGPVANKTGLDGTYDVTINVPMRAMMGRYDPEAADNVTLPAALKEIGLGVVHEQGEISYMVVDSADKRPSEN